MKLLKDGMQSNFIMLSGLFVLALVLRLLFVLSPHGVVMTPDGALYSNIAIHLLNGEGFIQNVRNYPIIVPPLYSIFLSFVYTIFGIKNLTAVLVIQALLEALTVIFIYKTAEELFNRWVGLFAGLFFSMYSVAIYHTGFILTETLFTFLVVLLTYAFTRMLRPQATYRTAGFVGLIWGLTCLTRPHLLFFVPFLCLLLLIVRKRHGFKLTVISTLILLITITPWMGYLYVKYNTIIPIASHGGIALWCGNGPFVNPDRYYNSTLYSDNPIFNNQHKEGMSLPLYKQGRFFRNTALQFITAHPNKFISNTYAKLNMFWKSVNLNIHILRIPLFDHIFNKIDHWMLILALPGFIFSIFPRWNFRRSQILLWLIIYYSLIVSVGIIVSQGRYRLPVMPLIAIYGGLTISVFLSSLAKGLKKIIHLIQKCRLGEKI